MKLYFTEEGKDGSYWDIFYNDNHVEFKPTGKYTRFSDLQLRRQHYQEYLEMHLSVTNLLVLEIHE